MNCRSHGADRLRVSCEPGSGLFFLSARRSELLHFGNAESEGDRILRPSAFESGQEHRSERS